MTITQQSLFAFETPSMPKLDVSRCYTKPIGYQTAARIVKTYHYAKRVPSIVLAVGMYVDDILAGVITYGMAAAPKLVVCTEQYKPNQLELSRLFVFDWAGRNSESWLVGQSFKWLKEIQPDKYILVSYADKGQNHTGYIYQATNWIYTGLSVPGGNPNEMYVNGERMTTKCAYDRYGSQGVKELEAMGLHVIKDKSKRTYKHRYIYFLGSKGKRKELRKLLKWEVLPYPKGNNT